MRSKAFVALALLLSLLLPASASAYPGYCEIEILNSGHEDVRVDVTFDDGSASHFKIHPHESPHYVSLFYYGHCHSQAHVRVQLKSGHVVYDSSTRAGSTVRILPH